MHRQTFLFGRSESPCTGGCVLDGCGTICVSCRRTMAEITAWSRLTQSERNDVLVVLKQRELPAAPNSKGTPKHE